MKIYTASQLRWLDQYTIENEPIRSIDLMERAASNLVDQLFHNGLYNEHYAVFCGTGNNGGDGFVIARILKQMHFDVTIYLVPFGEMTEDCQAQFEKVKQEVVLWNEQCVFEHASDTKIIDALLGIGSSRAPEGVLAHAIQTINQSDCEVISVDMPSGLSADEIPSSTCVVQATTTYTFNSPKLTFFLPETAGFVGRWKVVDIGLNQQQAALLPTRFTILESAWVSEQLHERKRFSHKGTYGHGLLIAGSRGKMGAACLSSEAALRSGLGLLTTHVPANCSSILQIAVPEAMCSIDSQVDTSSELNSLDLNAYSAIGIGPGISVTESILNVLEQVLHANKPTVYDADALNLLAAHPDLLKQLGKTALLTPHPKEFERLAGTASNSVDRLERLVHFAQSYHCTVVLKDAITAIATPDGAVCFSLKGNPGMATGGSGDVLTGMILGLLTQGYPAEVAAKIAVLHHGLAGDKAKKQKGELALLARDIIANIRIEAAKKKGIVWE